MTFGLRKYFSDPEQALLQCEVRRALRFLWSWHGLILVLLQTAVILTLPLLQVHLFSRIMSGRTGSGIFFSFFGMIYSTFARLGTHAIWMYLMYHWTFNRFRRDSERELLVLPLNGRMVWPAFLAAPFFWLVVMLALNFTVLSIQMLLPQPPQGRPPFYSPQVMMLFRLSGPWYSFAYNICLMLIVTRRILPKASFVHFLLTFIGFSLVVGVASALYDGFSMGVLQVGVPTFSYTRYLWYSIARQVLFVCIFAWLSLRVLRSLRNNMHWEWLVEKMREAA